jgi:hypothetical protein
MARDDTARDSDSEQSLLDRRSNLRLAEAAAATVATDETVQPSADEDPAGANVEVEDGS